MFYKLILIAKHADDNFLLSQSVLSVFKIKLYESILNMCGDS